MPSTDVPSRIRVAASVDELLAGATDRAPMKTGDSLSGARFERLRLDGAPHIVKYLCVDDDWLMRATGDLGCVQGRFWSSELVGRVPAAIDHCVVGVAGGRSPSGRATLALLMRDAGEEMVPEGSAPLDDERHLRFLDHMAQLHAAFWGWRDDLGLLPRAAHYTILTPLTAAVEAERGGTDVVPRAAAAGWVQIDRAAPRAAGLLRALLADPGPLVEGLLQTPPTFIQGDWKLGNLGSRRDGATVLIDWDRCGEGPACFELAWYLAVNCDRMRLSKEVAIDAYRAALERHGVTTESWWEGQLALALLGALLMLGWSKAGGAAAEMGWWEDRAVAAERYLA